MYADGRYGQDGLENMVEQYGFDADTALTAQKNELLFYALDYGLAHNMSGYTHGQEDPFEENRLTQAEII